MKYVRDLVDHEEKWVKDNLPRLMQQLTAQVNEALNINGTAVDVANLIVQVSNPRPTPIAKPQVKEQPKEQTATETKPQEKK